MNKYLLYQHPAIGKPFLDENCVIDVPKGVIGHTYEIDFSGNSILPLDTEFNWPLIKDKKNNMIDLSQIKSPDLKTAFCFYLKNLKDGWYGISNLKKGIGFGLKWDVKIFKFLWVWAVYRGFYKFPFYGRTYNIALEPWSAVPGNLDEVIKLNREISLLPKQELKTKFYAIVYKSDQRIKGYTKNNEVVKDL